MNIPKLINLTEYTKVFLESNDIPEVVGIDIWKKYKKQIDIEFPNLKTKGRWQMLNKGWVGYIPLAPNYSLSLQPKVAIKNLFLMMEYAYNLNSFNFINEIAECNTLEGFFERLANKLACLILERHKMGLYHSYKESNDQLPYIIGQININEHMRKPWDIKMPCIYQEHTANVEENQILLWTLFIIMRCGMCTDKIRPSIRSAYRSLQGIVTLNPFYSASCMNRSYNRLNQDYHSMHILCRFFLDYCGPSHETGDDATLPFLVNMAMLYELFIYEWLQVHLPTHLVLKRQESVKVGRDDEVKYNIDIVIYDASSGQAVYVLDTKYKMSDKPEPADISQIAMYALIKNCPQAILVYPSNKTENFKWTSDNGIRIRSLVFDIGGDIEGAGNVFLEELSAL